MSYNAHKYYIHLLLPVSYIWVVVGAVLVELSGWSCAGGDERV